MLSSGGVYFTLVFNKCDDFRINLSKYVVILNSTFRIAEQESPAEASVTRDSSAWMKAPMVEF